MGDENRIKNDDLGFSIYQPKKDLSNVFYNNTNETTRISTRVKKTVDYMETRDVMDYQETPTYNKPKTPTIGSSESGVIVTDTQKLDNGLEIKTYECKDCGMQSEFKNNIALHYKNKHATVKPYNCSFCDFGVARKDYLRAHIKKKHPDMCM